MIRTRAATRTQTRKVAMTEPAVDHDRFDVDRVPIDQVALTYGIETLTEIDRPAREQWLRAAQSTPLNTAAGNERTCWNVDL